MLAVWRRPLGLQGVSWVPSLTRLCFMGFVGAGQNLASKGAAAERCAWALHVPVLPAGGGCARVCTGVSAEVWVQVCTASQLNCGLHVCVHTWVHLLYKVPF